MFYRTNVEIDDNFGIDSDDNQVIDALLLQQIKYNERLNDWMEMVNEKYELINAGAVIYLDNATCLAEVINKSHERMDNSWIKLN